MTHSIVRFIPAILVLMGLHAWPVLLCHGSSVHAQVALRDADSVASILPHDTLDALSDWDWLPAFRLVIPRARRLAWHTIDQHSADSLAVLITGNVKMRWWSFRAGEYPGDEDCRVLAWRMLQQQYNGHPCPMREALVSVALTDALGRRHLVLALLDAEPDDCSREEYRWQLADPHFEYLPHARSNDDTTDVGDSIPMPKAHRDYVIKLVSVHPGNDAAYQFLREFDAMRDTIYLGHSIRYPGFLANLLRAPVEGWSLVDAGIRVETWKHVIGEAPTFIFPNQR